MRFKFMALYGMGSSGSDVLLDKSPEVPIGMKAPNDVVGAILEDMRMYSIKSTQKIIVKILSLGRYFDGRLL